MIPLNLKGYDGEVIKEASKEYVKEICRRSLFTTCKLLLGYGDVNKFTHASTLQALEADTKRKLIILPRGSLKSSICDVAYPIWSLLRDPNKRILIDSEIFGNSKTFLREIRAHLENPTLTELFGDFRTETDWAQNSITIQQRTKHLKESSITCGGVGTVKVGQHYDIIIGDDYNSNKNSETIEGQEKVLRHYKYNQSILEPDGIYIIVGTRYSFNDVPGYILDKELGLDPKHQITGEYDSDKVIDGLI